MVVQLGVLASAFTPHLLTSCAMDAPAAAEQAAPERETFPLASVCKHDAPVPARSATNRLLISIPPLVELSVGLPLGGTVTVNELLPLVTLKGEVNGPLTLPQEIPVPAS